MESHMAYVRVDSDLAENGVAVDMLNDGSLFVKIRSASAKAVEQERQRQQAPYRNIILSGRPLPPGIARELGQKITANAVVMGLAGVDPNGKAWGKIEDGKPVEFAKPDADYLAELFDAFPDFQEDVSAASQTNATFAAVAKVEIPSTADAVAEAAGNSPPSSDGGPSTAST
jgi:hypothetical protein